MIYRIDKSFEFQQDGQDWRKTVAPTYFQITPQVVWGQGAILFSVLLRNIDEDGKLYNGTGITLNVPFPELNLSISLQDILASFFEHHPDYKSSEFVALTWDQVV